MSKAASLTRNQRNKARNRHRKQMEHKASLIHWAECCEGRLVAWDCYCSYGCECCDIHQACSKCGRLYRAKDIARLSNSSLTKP